MALLQVLSGSSSLFSDILSKQKKGFNIYGPVASPLSKIKKKYRWQILIQGERNRSKQMRDFVKNSFEIYEKKYKFKDVIISVDVDPINMM